MDTITYNLESKKAKIKGVATQQGDGWLVGGSVKKMPDNTINIENWKIYDLRRNGSSALLSRR